MLVWVSDYYTIISINSLFCSAALLPVSPASSEPILGTASPPNPMETAPVYTTGIGTSGTCALAGLLCMYVIGERTVYTHSAVYCMLEWWQSERSPSHTADSSGSEQRDPLYKGACSH